MRLTAPASDKSTYTVRENLTFSTRKESAVNGSHYSVSEAGIAIRETRIVCHIEYVVFHVHSGITPPVREQDVRRRRYDL